MDLEKIRNDIVKDTIKQIKKYFIITNSEGDSVKENDILNCILKKDTKCIGVIQSSSGKIMQCSKNVIVTTQNSKYCKTHSQQFRVNLSTNKDENKIEIEYDQEDIFDVSKLKKTFIEDSFYYIDIVNNFIYTKNGQKAGIIEGENSNSYYLTTNPYILNFSQKFYKT